MDNISFYFLNNNKLADGHVRGFIKRELIQFILVFKILLLLFTLHTLISCIKLKDSEEEEVNGNESINNIDWNISDLKGTWYKHCYYKKSSDEYVTRKIKIEELGDIFKIIYDLKSYEDDNCFKEFIRARIIYEFIELGPELESSSGIREFDPVLKTATLIPSSPYLINYLNSNTFCDYSNWTVHEGVDITECPNLEIGSYNSVMYEIIKIDKSQNPHKLYFSDEDINALTPEERPEKLDTKYFVKTDNL